MASLEQIFAFESSIEPAWVEILKRAGLNPYQEFSDGTKTTPFVEVQLTSITPKGVRRDMWEAKLLTRVVTQRGKNSAQQAIMLGRIRIEALYFVDRFSGLTVHKIADLREESVSRGVDTENHLDWSEITHAITFGVPAGQWPV